jgi:hypothetical protein
MRWSLGRDNPELAQMPAQCIDDLDSLAHQKITRSKHHRTRLGFLTLDGNKPHGGSLYRFADRFGISGIILLALYKGLHIGWRYQADIVAELADLSSPVMSAAARLQSNQAGWKCCEKLENLCCDEAASEK